VEVSVASFQASAGSISLRRLIGVGAIVAAAATFAAPSKAQQFANLDEGQRIEAHVTAQCGTKAARTETCTMRAMGEFYRDEKAASEARTAALLKERATLEERTKAANEVVRESQCADELKHGVAQGALSRDEGRRILGTQKASEYGNCRLLGQLREFARLSKG
jgi:hypothetical protein